MYRLINDAFFIHFPGFVRTQVSYPFLKDILDDYAHNVKLTPNSDWTIITFGTLNSDYYPLIYQLDNNHIPYINPMANIKVDETFDCRTKMQEVAKLDIKTPYIAILDAGDGAFVKDITNLTESFESFGADIVFGANWIRHPNETIEDDVWDTTKPIHCLNGGVVFGRTNKVLEFYKHCVKISPTLNNPLRSEQKDMRIGILDMKDKIKFVLDYDRKLCVNTKASFEYPMFGYKNGIKSIWFEQRTEIPEDYVAPTALNYSTNDIVDISTHRLDKLRIRWQVTLLCNRQCSFCIQGPPEEHIKRSQGESGELYLKIASGLVRIIENSRRNISIALIGGEITMLKEFIPIIRMLRYAKTNSTIFINVTTNGTISYEKIDALHEIFKDAPPNVSIGISISYYPDVFSEEELIKKIKKILTIPRATAHVTKLIFKEEDIEWYDGFSARMTTAIPGLRVTPIIARFKHSNTGKNGEWIADISSEGKARLAAIIEKYISNPETKSNLQVEFSDGKVYSFRSMQEIISSLKENEFHPDGYMCNSGQNAMTIDHMGEVISCYGMHRSMGNICDEGFKMNDKPMLCNARRCNCQIFTHIWREKTK